MKETPEYQYAYYQTLRIHARSLVVDDLNKRIKTDIDHLNWKCITLASLDEEAVEHARQQWPRYYTKEYFGINQSWEHLYYTFARKPSHFNIAVWQELDYGKVLRGLALGDSPKGRTHLTLRWLERSYDPNYFRGGVLLPILATAEQYARLIGCQRVIIKDPKNVDEFKKYNYNTFTEYGNKEYKDSPQPRGSLQKEL